MKKWKQIILSLGLVAGAAGVLVPQTAGAINVFDNCNNGSLADKSVCKGSGDQASGVIKPIVNTLLFILGAISVVVIIIAGIRYTTSGGDSSAVAGAKNTLMYAIIGVIVALLAFAIVNFVVGRF